MPAATAIFKDRVPGTCGNPDPQIRRGRGRSPGRRRFPSRAAACRPARNAPRRAGCRPAVVSSTSRPRSAAAKASQSGVAGDAGDLGIIHSRPLQRPVRPGKAARLDDVDGHAEAGGEPQDRADIAGLVGLAKGEAHRVPLPGLWRWTWGMSRSVQNRCWQTASHASIRRREPPRPSGRSRGRGPLSRF